MSIQKSRIEKNNTRPRSQKDLTFFMGWATHSRSPTLNGMSIQWGGRTFFVFTKLEIFAQIDRGTWTLKTITPHPPLFLTSGWKMYVAIFTRYGYLLLLAPGIPLPVLFALLMYIHMVSPLGLNTNIHEKRPAARTYPRGKCEKQPIRVTRFLDNVEKNHIVLEYPWNIPNISTIQHFDSPKRTQIPNLFSGGI